MRRDRLPTPALVLDLDALDRNIAAMAAHAARAGVGLRCHAKSHKCVEIARRLQAAGALGPACATMPEAEAMAAGGLPGILVTSPVIGEPALDRLRRLLLRGADLTLAVDHPRHVADLAALATACGRELPLLVELDVGVGRTGCADPEAACALARTIAAAPALRFAGIQAYWGNLQQVTPFAERRARVEAQAATVRPLLELLRAEGLEPGIVTGGGTGTCFIDAGLGLFTELQPGSFLFLDSCYDPLDLTGSGNPFEPALFVATRVVSASRPGRAVVDAGLKALATDSGRPRPMRGALPGASYRFMGDEHGAIDVEAGDAPALGSVVELLTPHCDPTVNLHSRYHAVRGEEVVDAWAVVGRYQ